jgi:dihydroxy-acid dehydratase
MEDVQNIGGTPGVIKFMMDNGLFDGDQMTVTGKTHRQNLEDMNHPGLTPGQEIIRPLNNPIKPTGHLQMMYGNICPGGGVAKITGKEGETFTVRTKTWGRECEHSIDHNMDRKKVYAFLMNFVFSVSLPLPTKTHKQFAGNSSCI